VAPGETGAPNFEDTMNAKKAKAMRRDARTYAASLPETAHTTLRNGQDIVLPSSQRGLYRNLKRQARHKMNSVNAV
jgi:hypothetical protein